MLYTEEMTERIKDTINLKNEEEKQDDQKV